MRDAACAAVWLGLFRLWASVSSSRAHAAAEKSWVRMAWQQKCVAERKPLPADRTQPRLLIPGKRHDAAKHGRQSAARTAPPEDSPTDPLRRRLTQHAVDCRPCRKLRASGFLLTAPSARRERESLGRGIKLAPAAVDKPGLHTTGLLRFSHFSPEVCLGGSAAEPG